MGVFINREIEIEDKKAKERAWRNLMRESMTEGGRVIINKDIEVEEERV